MFDTNAGGQGFEFPPGRHNYTANIGADERIRRARAELRSSIYESKMSTLVEKAFRKGLLIKRNLVSK